LIGTTDGDQNPQPPGVAQRNVQEGKIEDEKPTHHEAVVDKQGLFPYTPGNSEFLSIVSNTHSRSLFNSST